MELGMAVTGLSGLIDEFYGKLAMSFHRNAADYQSREEIFSLSSTEMSTLEIVYLLGKPTCRDLTDFLRISTPNAAYRINRLIEKGFLEKEQDPSDRRRYYLKVTDKFMDYYCVNDGYMEAVAQRARQRFTPQENEQLEKMLRILIDELMD